MWIGNTLIIYSDPQALKVPSDGAYITSFIDKFYFTGYVLSSMGNGDYVPASAIWKFFTAFISFSGVLFMTLAISYLIPVVEAVTLKRLISIRIYQIGASPEDILSKHYRQGSYKELINLISSLDKSILKVAQNHLAYPVINYFHSVKTYESISIYLAVLDETISILSVVIPKTKRDENFYRLDSTKEAITFFLSTLKSAHISPSDDEPEHPDTSYFEVNEIPKLEDDEEIKNQFMHLVERRKLLLAYIQNDGWTWRELSHPQGSITIEQQ